MEKLNFDRDHINRAIDFFTTFLFLYIGTRVKEHSYVPHILADADGDIVVRWQFKTFVLSVGIPKEVTKEIYCYGKNNNGTELKISGKSRNKKDMIASTLITWIKGEAEKWKNLNALKI